MYLEKALSLIAWIVLGVFVGTAAAFALRTGTRDAVATILVSEVGAILGGFISSVVLNLEALSFNPASVLIAGIGAVLLVGVLRAFPDPEAYA
jgi:uncharacterized membrane protein YeaQ/YmgE (transglycosylase-associated protein family)